MQLSNTGLFKYVWLFIPLDTKGLGELNICEIKNCEIKVCELDLQKWKNYGMIANEDFYSIYLFIYGLYFALA